MSTQKLLRNTVFLMVAALSVAAIPSGAVLAEACTYREALMALEQGNAVRGMALMRMAGLDGDHRADVYLIRYDKARYGDVAGRSASLQISQFRPVRPAFGHLVSNNPKYRN